MDICVYIYMEFHHLPHPPVYGRPRLAGVSVIDSGDSQHVCQGCNPYEFLDTKQPTKQMRRWHFLKISLHTAPLELLSGC